MTAFADNLCRRIEDEYKRRGDRLGWRLLYSPESVLDGAEVALMGANPGGNEAPPDHAEFAMNEGSAYVREQWKNQPPGEESLQRQVRALFDWIGVEPESVLAGNVVPFRSPHWRELTDQRKALTFGTEIWTEILARSRPALVIAMGADAQRVVEPLLGISNRTILHSGWGKLTVNHATWSGGRYVGLLHLSQYRMFSREACRPALIEALGPPR